MTNLYKRLLECEGVTTDSRSVVPGNMFFALRGPNFDGNKYAPAALDAGARYVVVDDPSAALDDRYVLVEDALVSLQRLAAEHRSRLDIPVLAITGTNGKTTTKELTAAVLRTTFRVSVTQGNLNNHIGVPLTLLSIPHGTAIAVVEMGASGTGEIEHLCRIARPTHGIITNVGRAHLEGFGSEESIRQAKGELYDWISATGGTVFYRDADATLRDMAAQREGMNAIRYDTGCVAGLHLQLAGQYNLFNAAAAAAVGAHFGVTQDRIDAALTSYTPGNHRSQQVQTGRNILILDCYNANPSSMEAAITDFAGTGCDLPKMIILGDMLELGRYEEEEHRRVIELVQASGLEDAAFIGPRFARAATQIAHTPSAGTLGTDAARTGTLRTDGDGDGQAGTARAGFRFFPDAAAFMEFIAEEPIENHRILIKGSNGMGLSQLAGLF